MMTSEHAWKDETSWHLQYCPKCHKENYALNVMSGICTWCRFDANEETTND